MRHLLGGILLVAGTSIGAGMLALPLVTADGGFFPAILIYLLSWLFMTMTGLLLLELCLKLPPGANLISMANAYLKTVGRWAVWGLYLFLFYSLSVAYISGGSSILQGWFGGSPFFLEIGFVLFLGFCVFLGAKVVDRLNTGLMIGLVLSYVIFLFLGIPYLKVDYLWHASPSKSLAALPVIFTSFSYQGVIPTLTNYLKRDARKIRLAIIGGTSLVLLIYLLWETLILGMIPLEELLYAKEHGQTAVAPLKNLISFQKLSFVAQSFAFFAITTSFLGVTLGLFDFLADGFQVVKKGTRKLFLAFCTFFPPLLVSLLIPNLFIKALSFGGGMGCALLLGLFPILMVWISRYYHKGHEGSFLAPGGKLALILLFLFVLLELSIEL